MPLTTSDSQFDPTKGGTGKSKLRCWECNAVDKVYTAHPAYGYRVCRACVTRLGLKPVPIELVEDEDDGPKA